MAASKVVLTTSKTWLLEVFPSSEQGIADRSVLSCALKWRQGKLWVRAVQSSKQANIPALQNQQWLQDCLKHSPINVVCLDPQLGVAGLKYWADACEQAGKQIFLRLPGRSRRSRQPGVGDWLGQGVDSLLAALLLLLLSPILLGLFLLLRLSSSSPVFSSEWQVGGRGQLFRLISFRESDEEKPHGSRSSTSIRFWIVRLRLSGLPQLINVVQGKMRLVGRRPWNLHEAIQLCRDQPQPVYEMPGIVRIISTSFV